MGILVHLYYTGHNGSARAFVNEMETSGTAAQVRREEGCLQYDYFYSHQDPETVLLIEHWKDQAALDLHKGTERMQTILRLGQKYELSKRGERYQNE